jgi:oligoendopeptidase F
VPVVFAPAEPDGGGSVEVTQGSIEALLRGAGVDLGSPEPVEQTFAVLSSLVDRIEELLPA